MKTKNYGFLIDGMDILDYICDHRLFDKLWLLNRFSVSLGATSSTTPQIELMNDKERRDYLIKGFELIPIDTAIREQIGPEGIIEGRKESLRTGMRTAGRPSSPSRELYYLDSLIRENAIGPADASRIIEFLAYPYTITSDGNIIELLSRPIIKKGLEWKIPELLTADQFERLVDELLANDEYCKYQSAETIRPFSSIT